jgi:hypothetical protein
MDQLITSKTTGTHTFRGTQPLDSINFTAAISGPSSSSTQLDIPSNPKRKTPSYLPPNTISGPTSSSSNKKIKSSTPASDAGLKHDLLDAVGLICDTLRELNEPPPPPPPPPIPLARPSFGTRACTRLLEMHVRAKQEGDQWLLDSDVVKITDMFLKDEPKAEFFLIYSNCDEVMTRQWVLCRLEEVRAH